MTSLARPVSRWRSLISWFVLVASLALLGITLLSPPFERHGLFNDPKVKAKNDAVQIASAIDAFVAEYGYFPIPGHADVTLSESNRVAAGELMDVLSPSTNIPGKLNPRLISFLSIPKAVDGHNGRLNGHTGPYLDPWGKAYFIVVDGDGDGYVEGPSGHDPRAKIHQAVIVWSRGDPATAAFAEPAKWIKSWE